MRKRPVLFRVEINHLLYIYYFCCGVIFCSALKHFLRFVQQLRLGISSLISGIYVFSTLNYDFRPVTLPSRLGFNYPFGRPGCARKRGQPTSQPDLNPCSSCQSPIFDWVECLEGGIEWKLTCLGKRAIKLPHFDVTGSRSEEMYARGFKFQMPSTSIRIVCRSVSVVGWFPSKTQRDIFLIWSLIPSFHQIVGYMKDLFGRWLVLEPIAAGVWGQTLECSSTSPALRLVLQSEMSWKGLPLHEMNLLKAIKNVSASTLSRS